MAVFDIINEMAQQQVMKTELGEERIFGAVLGIVAANYDQNMPGRICVTVPVRDEFANQLKWARVAAPYSGKKWGQYFLPEVGDQVILIFEDGNIEKPYIIGCISKDNDQLLRNAVSEKNVNKCITTRNGSRVSFEDDENESGSKDKITVATAGNAHSFLLDNENQKMVLTDKENNCHLEMGTKDGSIQLTASKSLTIKVGSNIQITMNGNNGSVHIQADKFTVAASKNINLEATGNARVSGQQTMIEATTSLKNSSSGILTLEGKPIKIG